MVSHIRAREASRASFRASGPPAFFGREKTNRIVTGQFYVKIVRRFIFAIFTGRFQIPDYHTDIIER